MTASVVALRSGQGAVGRREHVDRAVYRDWLMEHATNAVRWDRLKVYDEFVGHWPDLEAWFAAPLQVRVSDRDGDGRGYRRAGSRVLMPYLVYLSLVQGVSLDHDLLLARTFSAPFKTRSYPSGLGVDHEQFERHVARLVQLGYGPVRARTVLLWSLGRMLLHRGDPDLAALSTADVVAFNQAIDAFAGRLDADQIRALYHRTRPGHPPAESAEIYRTTGRGRLHAAHLLLFQTGQISVPPPSQRRDAGSWIDRLVPVPAPPAVTAVVDRYLRLRLEAHLDRPQTVRHIRDALARLLTWLGEAHPEMSSLADLTREHAEEFLRWFGT